MQTQRQLATGQRVLGVGFRRAHRARRVRLPPFGPGSVRDELSTALAHEIVPCSAISAATGLETAATEPARARPPRARRGRHARARCLGVLGLRRDGWHGQATPQPRARRPPAEGRAYGGGHAVSPRHRAPEAAWPSTAGARRASGGVGAGCAWALLATTSRLRWGSVARAYGAHWPATGLRPNVAVRTFSTTQHTTPTPPSTYILGRCTATMVMVVWSWY